MKSQDQARTAMQTKPITKKKVQHCFGGRIQLPAGVIPYKCQMPSKEPLKLNKTLNVDVIYDKNRTNDAKVDKNDMSLRSGREEATMMVKPECVIWLHNHETSLSADLESSIDGSPVENVSWRRRFMRA
eukprot:2685557-Amphidinium_carterae.1